MEGGLTTQKLLPTWQKKRATLVAEEVEVGRETGVGSFYTGTARVMSAWGD